jgi:hypothetical protein
MACFFASKAKSISALFAWLSSIFIVHSNAAIICSFGVEAFVLFLSTKGVTEKLSN